MSAIVHDQPVAFQHRRVSRVLIEIAQRWIVKTGAVEQVGARLGHHRDQTEINKFGRVFTRTELCERVWEHPHEYDTKLVEVFIGRLRRKLANLP